MTTERHSDDAKLWRIIESARPDTTPPHGARERLEAKLRRAIRAKRAPTRPTVRKRAVALVRRGGLVAATLAAAVCVAWWLSSGGVSEARADFAEVLRALRKAETVAYTVVMRIEGEPEETARVLADDEGGVRATWHDGRISIHGRGNGRWLHLTSATRTARWVHASDAAPIGEPLEALRRATVDDGRYVGREMLNGQWVELYRVEQPGGALRVWVDPQGDLPVRVEGQFAVGTKRPALVLEQFKWNEPVPDEAFVMGIPEGYRLESPDWAPSPAALAEALRGCAERNGGVFPPQFDRATVARLFVGERQRQGVLHIPQDSSSTITVMPEADESDKAFYRASCSALDFVKDVRADGDWRYMGGGVRLGDTEAPVCRWRRADESMFHVMYGDLKIRAVPAGEVMEPESMLQ